MTVRLLHGHERSDDRARADDEPVRALTVSERYSVDELHAVARLSGRDGFPGVPVDDDQPLSPRERAVVTDVVLRSLVARGVISADDAHADRAARVALRGRARPGGDVLDPALPPGRAVVAQRVRARGPARRRDLAVAERGRARGERRSRVRPLAHRRDRLVAGGGVAHRGPPDHAHRAEDPQPVRCPRRRRAHDARGPTRRRRRPRGHVPAAAGTRSTASTSRGSRPSTRSGCSPTRPTSSAASAAATRTSRSRRPPSPSSRGRYAGRSARSQCTAESAPGAAA